MHDDQQVKRNISFYQQTNRNVPTTHKILKLTRIEDEDDGY